MYNLLLKCWSRESRDRPNFDFILSSIEKMLNEMNLENTRVAVNIDEKDYGFFKTLDIDQEEDILYLT